MCKPSGKFADGKETLKVWEPHLVVAAKTGKCGPRPSENMSIYAVVVHWFGLFKDLILIAEQTYIQCRSQIWRAGLPWLKGQLSLGMKILLSCCSGTQK
ncbi:hypothetical protein DY000_02057590 [Brassica cretica]|uniref:Uncharacterized protein n=1 Tax=Brassica cretica TaxID=69181 RepID=A0ABQ7A8F9_BRACR|nr:hypothetical protein DY000_02057590 [Brassica cretica]